MSTSIYTLYCRNSTRWCHCNHAGFIKTFYDALGNDGPGACMHCGLVCLLYNSIYLLYLMIVLHNTYILHKK